MKLLVFGASRDFGLDFFCQYSQADMQVTSTARDNTDL
jgi:short-subunit dehydrogenase